MGRSPVNSIKAMSFSKKLPWPSLAILLLTYTTFGCTLPPSHLSLWLLAAIFAGVLSAGLTAPLRKTKGRIVSWLKTDLGMFVSVIVIAFVTALMLSRIQMFANPMILLFAGALARLDVQTAGFDEWQAFWILTVASAVGLGLGWILQVIGWVR